MILQSTVDDDTNVNIFGTIVKGVIIFWTIAGNLLVCTAVLTERRLREVKSNYFLMSLAGADLLVGCFVDVFSLYIDIHKKWELGPVLCNIWMSSDVMCCTASLLHLCVISFSRHKQVQCHLHYDAWMTTKRIVGLIVSVWLISALLSFPPIHLGWYTLSVNTSNVENATTEHLEDICFLSINMSYLLIVSAVAFYIPCLFMFFFYFELFRIARKHASIIAALNKSVEQNSKKSRTLSFKSDQKAAITLGVIIGVFLACWLPFFLVWPMTVHDGLVSHISPFFGILTWLGYANSCMNPIIYSIFNLEFREAYLRILSLRTCRKGLGFSPSQREPSSRGLYQSTNAATPYVATPYAANAQHNSLVVKTEGVSLDKSSTSINSSIFSQKGTCHQPAASFKK